MEVRQGYSYHIKDEFFERMSDKYLMSNKENGNYRPHFYAIRDSKQEELLWMIPISSQVEKYKKVVEKKIQKYGKCNTIIIGRFAGKENAFLIQNAFPIRKEYLDHIHTIENKPIKVHDKLDWELTVCLKEILAMHKRGIHLFFPDVDKILNKLNEEKSEER